MYWLQSDEEIRQEIKDMVAIIRRVTDEVVAQGPEACMKFLINAGILEE